MNPRKSRNKIRHLWIRDSEKIILIINNLSNTSKLLLVVLGLLCLLAFLGPFIFMILLSDELTSGFLVTIGIFWFVGFYFLRLLLWNTNGREQIEISKNKIIVYHDFKYFKLYHGSIDTVSLSISYLLYNSAFSNQSDKGGEMRVLVFRSGSKAVRSFIPLKLSQAVKIRSEILNNIETL
jgi:hypothetical protein